MPRPEMFTQLSLSSGNQRMVCLVAEDPRIKIGTQITLKDSETPTALWTVTEIGQSVQRQFIHHDWHNNI